MKKGIRMLPDVRTDAKMCSDMPAASSFRSPVITWSDLVNQDS